VRSVEEDSRMWSRNFSSWLKVVVVAGLVVCMTGCGSSLAQPFESMKSAPITAFRLQNFEPPAPAANATTPGVGGLQLPPQIQSWITAGAALLPPGLLPPGIMPGAAPMAAPAQNVQRFHEFRILATMNVNDAKLHDEVLAIFGTEKNFEVPREQCMFAEFGFSIGQINQPPADILVSLSCNQIRSFGFAWPHGAKIGMTGDTAKRIITVMQKTFGG
jgi:hypothetical protein